MSCGSVKAPLMRRSAQRGLRTMRYRRHLRAAPGHAALAALSTPPLAPSLPRLHAATAYRIVLRHLLKLDDPFRYSHTTKRKRISRGIVTRDAIGVGHAVEMSWVYFIWELRSKFGQVVHTFVLPVILQMEIFTRNFLMAKISPRI